MAEPWTYSGEVARLSNSGGAVTLIEGTSFCISDARGDIVPGGAHGLFFLDTRFLARLELFVEDHPVESLGVAIDEPFEATFLCRALARAGQADSGVVVVRRRSVGYGLRETIELRNYDIEPRTLHVEVRVGVDFADLFAVKESRVRRRGAYTNEIEPASIRFGHRHNDNVRETEICFSHPDDIDGDRASWDLTLGPATTWSTTIVVSGIVNGDVISLPAFPGGLVREPSGQASWMADWRQRTPDIESSNHALVATVRQSIEDLGALRLFDPAEPELPVVAAGAPWFMTLFGRDSLLTAWMALPVEVDLARGVVETLARLQGSKVDPDTEEEPGKILHELRFGGSRSLSLASGSPYYGSVDATPLFVVLLGELRRWGLEDDVVRRMLPHADRALAWIADYGDRDGDGFVEYERMTPRGLANQGWKDSWDGIRYGDGRVAHAPLALCEVQGYVYAAYVARAHFAFEAGDQETEARYRLLASDLKAAFNRDFWLEDRGWFAAALDGDKQPVDSLTSNIGHCLWAGIVDEDKAASVARHLLSDDMYSGWGVRTLAASCGGYNPISYHCGSVWPHDNALIAAGLMRYGFVAEAHRIVEGMLDVGASLGGRLPELFAGIDRSELDVPAAYPTSCVPQAWAAASPVLLLRVILRLDPWLTHRKLWLAPALPPSIQWLRVGNISLGGGVATIEVDVDGGLSISGLADDVEVVHEPRRPLTAALDT